jgi:hypothetical protein
MVTDICFSCRVTNRPVSVQTRIRRDSPASRVDCNPAFVPAGHPDMRGGTIMDLAHFDDMPDGLKLRQTIRKSCTESNF